MSRQPRRSAHFSGPFTCDELRAAGYTKAELRGWLARGEVRTVARGVYLTETAQQMALRDVVERRAVLRGSTPASIRAAAAFHEVWLPPDLPAMLTSTDSRRVIPREHLTPVGAMMIPSLAWTVVQLARAQPLHGALIPLDFALAHNVPRAELTAIADEVRRWPGSRGLHAAICAADGGSESPLESWSRGRMIGAGLPVPELQVTLTVAGQRMRPDFLFRDARLIGEADGRAKYGDGRAPIHVVGEEQRRQARLQSAGFLVYRWGWPEVRHDCSAWLHGLRSALQRGAPRH